VLSQKNSNLKENFIHTAVLILVFLSILNCEKKKAVDGSVKTVVDIAKNNSQAEHSVATDQNGQDTSKDKAEKERSQDLKKKADLIRFLASIEKESLKVVLPSLGSTQWEMISFAFDKFVGIKKSNGGYFCHQFEVIISTQDQFEIFAICEKPRKKLADLYFGENSQIIFYSKNWAPVIGEFPALTAPDRSCQFAYKETTIASFNCKNTIYALPPENVEELRLEKFEYDRTASDQVSIVGGIFKDLVKRRDLQMKIPASGAIEIVERELKVRDDFEHLLKKTNR
jgi:hypothetical protein